MLAGKQDILCSLAPKGKGQKLGTWYGACSALGVKTSESSLKHHGRAVSPWGCQSARPSSAADGPGACGTIQQALSAFASPSHISPRRPRAVRFSVPPGAEFLTRAPSFFRPLFRSAQKWPLASKMVTPGAPRESPKHQNPGKIASRT